MKNYSFIPVSLLLLLLLGVSLHLFSQPAYPKFKHLTTNEGLSQNHVSTILKDHNGFMWFATDEGLNRYDGYNFVVYKYDADKTTSIGSNYVYDLLEDNTGALWVGTGIGLDKFDREKNVFTHYRLGNNAAVRHVFQDSNKRIWLGTTVGLLLLNPVTGACKSYRYNDKNLNNASPDFIYRIAEDNNGELWIATQGGLNRFDPRTGSFRNYQNEPGNSNSIGATWIKTVYKDDRGNIWAGTQGSGIAFFKRETNSFINYKHDAANPASISHNDILSFAQGNDGRLWVGTENGGISVFDYTTNTFTVIQNNSNDNASLSNNSVYCLYKDNTGNMWAGTWSGGVNLLPHYGEKFMHYKQIADDKKSLSSNIILAITGDSTRNIWIGTDGGGLNCFDPVKHTFSHYQHDNNNKNSVSSDYVLSIVEVEPGLLGIGYHRGGFDLFNSKTGIFTHHLPSANGSNSIAALSVNVVMKDHLGRLWLGTWGGGLNVYDRKTKQFTLYQHMPGSGNSISSNFIHSLLEDSQGNILVGTEMGLDVIDIKNNHFTNYHNQTGNKQTLNNNMVESILEDHAGNLWVGTAGGLNLFDREKGKFTAYTEKDGLANNLISAMLEDKSGVLWISSNQGLTRFDPVHSTCRSYTTADGLQGNAFKARCVYKSPDGAMFFGGANGFNVFHPDSLPDNDFLPPIFITDFQVFNKRVAGGDKNTVLPQDITVTKQINLSYQQSVFTFEFAALNYTLPEQNQYAYKLEGFDKDWTQVSAKRTATYTNLDGGEYIFRVKGSNNDGLWNTTGASVKIIITPPWWRTWWSTLAFFMAVSGGALAFYFYRINIVKSQQKELQRRVREQTGQLVRVNEAEREARHDAEKSRQEAEDANKAKSIFLATMSHEIRTPMNGVIGMASLLDQTELSGEQKEYVASISSCGESLLNVINDILDFSKIESGNMELERRDFDLRTCIEEVLDIFATKAVQTGLDLVYEIDSHVPPQITGDSLRIRQVLMNLVGNAIKFTHRGEIFVKVQACEPVTGDEMEISFEVKDTGIGIPPDKMKHLFKAFSQVDSSITRKYGGTGLGLVICEKLIGLMGGQIMATSTPGQGASFTFTIKTKAGSNAEWVYPDYNMSSVNGKRVLVVDDNTTNRRILENQLHQWKLATTLVTSGNEALALLTATGDFDLVLTDFQMPEMDGIELSRQIKQRHPSLPVILLSSAGDNYLKEHADLFGAVLNKPIRQHMLSRAILTVLQQPGHVPLLIEQKDTEKLSVDFAQQHPLRILVAEDNLINQHLILKILGVLGYLPSLAENGLEVLEMMLTANYDMILMDVQMPEMDGLETTKNIRKKEQVQPIIIAMTANAMQGDQEECLQAGMNDYLSKPVILNDLVIVLKKWADTIGKTKELLVIN